MGLYVLIYAVIPIFFKKYPYVHRWTVGKELRNLLCFFLAVLFVNGIYCLLNIPVNMHLHDYLLSIMHISFSADFMPILLVTLIHHFYVVKFTKQETNETVQSLPENEACIALEVVEADCAAEIPAKATDSDSLIDLTMVNGKKYPEKDVWFFHVDGNYTYIHYLCMGKITRDSLPISLVKLKDVLDGYPRFVECRCSHLVHLGKIEKITGPNKKKILKLQNCKDEIRVPYNKAEKIKNIWIKYKDSID